MAERVDDSASTMQEISEAYEAAVVGVIAARGFVLIWRRWPGRVG